MELIEIREDSGRPNGAVLRIDGFDYPVTVTSPFEAEKLEELDWYFEQLLRFPFGAGAAGWGQHHGLWRLAIGPGKLDLGQPMFDAILLAAHIKHMCRVSCRRAARVARRESELNPIVGENRVDLVGDSRDA
jgi:hypothetical protein